MRLIDADALIKDGIKGEYGLNDNGLILIPLRDVRKSIKNARTIEPRTVVHGKWIERNDFYFDTYYDCSECGESFDVEECSIERCYYCPNCGAKMDMD